MSDYRFDAPAPPALSGKQYLLRLAGALLFTGALHALGGVMAMMVFVVIGFIVWLLSSIGLGWSLLILLGLSR